MANALNTSNLRVYWDPAGGTSLVAIAKAIDASVQFTKEMKDSTTKDSGTTKEVAPTFSSATVQTSGLYAVEAENGKDLVDILLAGTEVTIRFTTTTSLDDYFEFSAYCTSVELGSPGVQDNATYSVTFESNGAITTGNET